MSILKKLASQTAVYGLSTMVGRFLNFLLVPLYTAKLALVGDYGVVSVMFAYASFGAVLAALGLETGFFHFARKTDNPARVFATAGHTLIMTGLLAVLTAKLFALPIMDVLGYPEHPEYAFWFAIILAADALSALGFAWLRQQEKPWTFAAVRLTNIGVNIGANLFFVLLCPYLASQGHEWAVYWARPEQMVSNIFLSNLLASLITLPLLAGAFSNLREGLDRDLLNDMLRYSLPMVVVGLAGMVNETLDRILLKHLLLPGAAEYEVGVYSAFYKLSLVLTLFVQAFRFAAEPFFFSRAGDEKAPETYAYVMRWFSYVVGFLFLATLVSLPFLGPLLIRNPQYFADNRGMSVVPILLAANVCLGLYYNLSVWYKVSGKTQWGAIIALGGALLTLVGNFYLIPRMGFEGSAWTTLGAYASMVIAAYIWGQKAYPIPYELGKILPGLLLAFACGYAVLTMPELQSLAWMAVPAYLMGVWLIERPWKRIKSKS